MMRFSRRLWQLMKQLNVRKYSSSSSTANDSFSSKLFSLLTKGNEGTKEGLGYTTSHTPALQGARNALLDAVGFNKSGTAQHAIAPETVAANLCDHYHSLGEDEEQKKAFFAVLAGDLGVDHDSILSGAQLFCELHTQKRNEAALLKSEGNMRNVLTPFYSELFSVIARLEGGIKFLVDIRGDLLGITKSLHSLGTPIHHLSEMNENLRSVLSHWFTPQLMDLQQITWESPCDILEKISLYEAVHPLRHWKDLKHRVGENRRCFIFTHKAIPREPIVVLHVALTDQPSRSIQVLLNRTIQECPNDLNTAVFYSISATQKGLSGVELGNFLIRRVATELQREFPQQLQNFVTLSPIPGFRKWLESHVKLHSEQDKGVLVSKDELKDVLHQFPDSDGNHVQTLQKALGQFVSDIRGEKIMSQAVRQPLTSLCARYLATVKRRGRALDPVAHFHLSNGASIWRVNWLGDVSPNGLQRSFGFMVNYRYHMPDVSSNSDAYRMNGTIPLSESVQNQL